MTSVLAGAISGATGAPGRPLEGYDREFYSAKESAAVVGLALDSALIATGLHGIAAGGGITVASLGTGAAAGVPAMAVGAAAAGTGALGLRLHTGALEDVRDHRPLLATDRVPSTGKMLGADGPRVSSHTVYNQKGVGRIDIENPAPGGRAGQIHLQVGGKKYYYDLETESFVDAPHRINQLLDRFDVQRAISRALHYLRADK